MDKTAARHLAAIQAGNVTKSNVIGIRKILNHVARLERRLSGNRCNATPADADTLADAIAEHKPRVSGELHDSGLKLLQGKRYAKRLEPVGDLVATLTHFSLVGWEWLDDLHAVALYRAHAPGGSFVFRNVPWQSGGNGPEVISTSRESGK